MKCSLSLLSVLGLNLGLAVAQDMQQISQALTAMGFPACAVPCVLAGNKAAAEKAGCALMDQVCQCTTGFKAAQEGVMGCMAQTKPCPDADMAKVATAGANLCAGSSKQTAPPGASNGPGSSGTASTGTASSGTGSSGTGSSGSASSGTKPSGTVASASAATTSGPAGGAHAAAGPSSTHNAAMPQRTLAAGAIGLVGAVVALVV